MTPKREDMNQEISQKLENIIKKIKTDNQKEAVINFFTKEVNGFNREIADLEQDLQARKITHNKASQEVCNNIRHVLNKAQKIEKIIEEGPALKKIKQAFREEIKDFIDKSRLIQRGAFKLSGYPGDFKTIEIFYDKKPISQGIGFGGDKYVLQDSYVKAVRMRKDMMKEELVSFIKKSQSSSLAIMNLGCGSCRELRELLSKMLVNKKLNFTLVDWDKKALQFSKKSLESLNISNNIKFKFKKLNIFEFFRSPDKYSKMLKKQDLIYSIGLADYMPNIIFGETIKFCFDLLKEKGTLMISHKNVKVHKSYASDWFCDWNFYPRNIEDAKKAINESLKGYKFTSKIVREKTNHIFFMVVNKA